MDSDSLICINVPTVSFFSAAADCNLAGCMGLLVQVRLNGQIVTEFLSTETLMDDNGEPTLRATHVVVMLQPTLMHVLPMNKAFMSK